MNLDIDLGAQQIPDAYLSSCTDEQRAVLQDIRTKAGNIAEIIEEQRKYEKKPFKTPVLSHSDRVYNAVADITHDTRPARMNQAVRGLSSAVRRAVELGMSDLEVVSQYAAQLGINI